MDEQPRFVSEPLGDNPHVRIVRRLVPENRWLKGGKAFLKALSELTEFIGRGSVHKDYPRKPKRPMFSGKRRMPWE